LPKDDCRYVVYDLMCNTGDRIQKKIIFIFWAPDNAPVRKKMIYAASEDSIKKKVEVAFYYQAHDFSELDYEDLRDRFFSSK